MGSSSTEQRLGQACGQGRGTLTLPQRQKTKAGGREGTSSLLHPAESFLQVTPSVVPRGPRIRHPNKDLAPAKPPWGFTYCSPGFYSQQGLPGQRPPFNSAPPPALPDHHGLWGCVSLSPPLPHSSIYLFNYSDNYLPELHPLQYRGGNRGPDRAVWLA